MTGKPHIPYFGMGPWPIYVGFSDSPKAFRKEMKRIGNKGAPFVNPGADATMHTFVKDGVRTCIITLRKSKKASPEQVAATIAHEAVHVAQELWEGIGEHRPGREAEAYLIQMITQCCLQEAWKTNRVRRTEP